ncbi:Exodeoxyribonuclease VII small subunit [Eubacterium ruminantium]|nr:Exodeoxyribonuclease VII small subunit [Eubacterium ruminantium]
MAGKKKVTAEKTTENTAENIAAEEFVIENAFDRLEEIIGKLEDPETKLMEAMELYKEGVVLSEKCKTNLEGVEKEIKILNPEEV